MRCDATLRPVTSFGFFTRDEEDVLYTPSVPSSPTRRYLNARRRIHPSHRRLGTSILFFPRPSRPSRPSHSRGVPLFVHMSPCVPLVDPWSHWRFMIRQTVGQKNIFVPQPSRGCSASCRRSVGWLVARQTAPGPGLGFDGGFDGDPTRRVVVRVLVGLRRGVRARERGGAVVGETRGGPARGSGKSGCREGGCARWWWWWPDGGVGDGV